MVDSICIFEGIYYKRLLPLVYFRPQYDLRCGILSLREKILKQYPDIPVSLHGRTYLNDLIHQQNPNSEVNHISAKSCLFINGRVIVDDNFRDMISPDGPDRLYIKGDTIIAARVSGSKLDELKTRIHDLYTLSDFNNLVQEEVDVTIVSYPWDLISNLGDQLRKDFHLMTRYIKGSKIFGKVYEGAHLLNKDNIYIGKDAVVKPGSVIDAEDGPVYIDDGAYIYPNAVIIGPAFIGKNSIVKIGTQVYPNVSVGEVCKIGGEIEDSIIHSHSNKAHGGFLGHSYLAQWVNLGADTNNSDLKNNYGSVKVFVNGDQIDSRTMFVGLTVGDHTKAAINTMFNTGTVVGAASNIFGPGFPRKYIPSFSWGGAEMMTSYDLERSLEVAKRAMERRNMELTDIDERLFRKVYDITKEERRKLGMPH